MNVDYLHHHRSDVRRGLTELYFRLMIDIEFKKTFALSFFRYYKFLMTYYKELSRATNRQNSVLGISGTVWCHCARDFKRSWRQPVCVCLFLCVSGTEL